MNADDVVLRLVEVFRDSKATNLCNIELHSKAKKIVVYESDKYEVVTTLGGSINVNLHEFRVFFKKEYTTHDVRRVEGCESIGEPFEVNHYKQIGSWVTVEDSDILLYLFSLIRENEHIQKLVESKKTVKRL